MGRSSPEPPFRLRLSNALDTSLRELPGRARLVRTGDP
jgi:hypothetical protein